MKEFEMPQGESGYPKEIQFNLDDVSIDIIGGEGQAPAFEVSDGRFTFDLDEESGKLIIERDNSSSDLSGVDLSDVLGSNFVFNGGGTLNVGVIGHGSTANIGSIGPGSTGIVDGSQGGVNIPSIGPGSKGIVYGGESGGNPPAGEITLKNLSKEGDQAFDITINQESDEDPGEVEVLIGGAKINQLNVELKAGSLAVNSSELSKIDVEAGLAQTRIQGVSVENAVNVESFSGDVRISGKAEAWNIRTKTGDVTVSPSTEGDVIATSSYGEVYNNRPPAANQ